MTRIIKVAPMEDSSSSVEKNFAWSFQPLLIGMKFAFVDLGHYDGHSLQFLTGFKSKLLTLLGILLFFINFASQIASIYLRNEKRNSFSGSSNIHLNVIIEMVNYAIRNVVIHLSMLIVARLRWKKLWKSVRKMESFINPQDTEIYHHFRNICLFGLLYTLCIVIHYN